MLVCALLQRFEGGKWVCSPYEILSPEPCFVFSLGCNGISGFEEDIKARYPHCTIHIYDPTTSEHTAAEVAARTQARELLAVFNRSTLLQRSCRCTISMWLLLHRSLCLLLSAATSNTHGS